MQKSLHSEDYQHFLAELRAVRERAGVSQERLAELLGEHQTLISKVERGVRRLDVVELRRWLLALGESPVEFVQCLDERIARNSGLRRRRSQ
jgi:transcriptional regulator with XRE-family HTH domain